MNKPTFDQPLSTSGPVALLPLVLFIVLYLGGSLVLGDFYKIPVTVAFLTASVVSIAIMKGMTLSERIDCFSRGAGEKNLLLMVWIFVLAGAFANGAKEMGAIDAAVNLTLHLLPGQLLLSGIFLAACFISISVGTSVGTTVALTPVAVGIAMRAGIDVPFMVGIVVGGAFFGDNLSFISDTTIAATQTQGCSMRDKFKANIQIVLPAAIICFLMYILMGTRYTTPPEVGEVEWLKVVPYLLVIVTAVMGVNVMVVLLLGILACGAVGLLTGTAFFAWFSSMGTGIIGMGELIILTLLAGGMLETIRYNGGIDYIISRLTRRIKSKRGAELSIAALVAFTNLCTANNTVAIITTGSIARNITQRYGIDPRKTASILDTFSCLVQGLIPYGAQVLMAAGLASVAPGSIVRYLYYPMIMGVCATLAIIFRFPRKYS